MHTISDSKRQQTQVPGVNPTQSSGAAQIRKTSIGNSVWQQSGNVLVGESAGSTNPSQRPAGKASGLKYTQNDKGKVVDQSNNQHWKSTMEWFTSEEKVPPSITQQRNNTFTQHGKQQMNFNSQRRMHLQQQTDRFGQAQANTTVRAQYNQFSMGTPGQTKYLNAQQRGGLTLTKESESANAAVNQTPSMNLQFAGGNSLNSSAQTIEPGETSGSGNMKGFNTTGMSFRGSMDAQMAKPQLIGNSGGSNVAKRIPNRINKGKQPQLVQDAGLKVMGIPMKPDQQLLTQTVQHGETSFTEDLIEMTPDQSKDKYKKRMIGVGQLEAGTSIMKAPIHGKAQLNPVFMSSQDQVLQEHKRLADDGNQHRRAESMGKQKMQSKFSNKAEEHGLEDFLKVKNFKQREQQSLARRGKKSKHHGSFQGGMRPLINKNAPFKRIQTNSTTTSQLNDSGHGSGGNAPASMTNTSNINVNVGGLNTTMQSSDQEHVSNLIQNSQIKNRRQIPMVVLHPAIQNRNQMVLNNEAPRQYIPQHFSPAPNRSNQLINSQVSDQNVLSKGEQKMQQLHKQFIEQDPYVIQQAPTASPQSISIKQTPLSHRKKKAKHMVLRGDHQQPSIMKSDRLHLPGKDEVGTEENQIVKESAKHRNIRKMIQQNKHINNLNVSSFASQERDGSQSGSNDEDDIRRQSQPDVQQLQQLQLSNSQNKENNNYDDTSSEDTLSRDPDARVNVYMAIDQGYTPSGLATSNTQNKQNSSQQPEENRHENFVPTKEFKIEEETKDDGVILMTSMKEQKVPSVQSKHQSVAKLSEPKEQKKMHQLFNKASMSMEKQRESENFSKHNQSSSDSSFQQAFEILLLESDSLKWQFEEILLKRLSPMDHAYSSFVKRIIAKNKERQQKNFAHSMPAQRKKEQLLENKFTSENVAQHIENEKKRRHSEHVYRPFHSDMSRRFFANSMREDHPSITSPNFSGTIVGNGLRHLHLRHERRRRLHRILSFSNGVTYHAKSAKTASNFLPELSYGGRYRNSMCQFGGNPFGISESNSHVHFNNKQIDSSNSNQTVPTPIRQDNKKLDDLQDATNRVQIATTSPDKMAAIDANPQNNNEKTDVNQIYEKLNMDDRKKAQMAHYKLPPRIQQQKREQNFFPATMPLAEAARQLPAQVQASPVVSKKLYGKAIEWQIGKLLGLGSTGEVYEALNIDTGETFAVKMIKLVHPYMGLDKNKVNSVRKEINRYKLLNHKHIVKYYDSEIIENNVLCIYLEYVYGSIDKMYKNFGGHLGESIVRKYTQQILRALVYMHEMKVIHGDLKGANVLVSQDGKEIKLCDMGNSIIKPAMPLKNEKVSGQTSDNSASTRSLFSVHSLVASSPAWMAPETQTQKFGYKSDIWSLGCLMIEMLTGKNPWGDRLDNESSVLLALQRRMADNERPIIPSDVSEECQNFIDRCLKHNFRERPTAEQLLDDPWIKNKEHATIQSPQIPRR